MMRQLMTSRSPSRTRASSGALSGVFASAAFVCLLGAGAIVFPCETLAQIAGTAVPDLEADLVAASLVSDSRAIAPGRTFRLAVRLAPREGWHLNWLNPGDAGLAPGVAWKLPPGFTAMPHCWPFPERFRTGPLVIFGYAGELLLVADVTPPANLVAGGSAEFRAEVSWLACADACIPGSASVSVTLPVRESAATDAESAPRLAESERRCPRPAGDWTVQARVDDSGTIAMDIAAGGRSAPLEDVFFYPYDPGIIENAAPQRLSVLASPTGRAAYQLRVDIARMATAVPARLSGILVSRQGFSGGGQPEAIEIDVPLDRR
jgi:thiol:disulfide interchange protein DsbD